MHTDRWKYYYYPAGTVELFNMGNDPGERNNLAQQERCADAVKSMNTDVLKF